MIITSITCPYCKQDYSGLKALEHLDKEIEMCIYVEKSLEAGLARQGFFNLLTLLLAKRQILEKNLRNERGEKC